MFRYLENQENETNKASAISKALSEEKQGLVDEIMELNKQLNETDNEMRKIEDSLLSYKDCKDFIDKLTEFRKSKEKERGGFT